VDGEDDEVDGNTAHLIAVTGRFKGGALRPPLMPDAASVASTDSGAGDMNPRPHGPEIWAVWSIETAPS
jgi:hypothetical protein